MSAHQTDPVQPVQPAVDQMVARAALCRAVLLGRAAATGTAAGAGLRIVDDPGRLALVLGVVALTTVAGLVVLARRPQVVRRAGPILLVDGAVVLGVLALSHGGVAFFGCAVGASALAGVLLGMRSLALTAGYAALGYLVAAGVLHSSRPPVDIAAFVLAFPMACGLAGIGTAVATAALVRYVDLSVRAVASAQRSAAAAERSRLARELHDSVSKTLRGVSFAALALPSSLRRHPSLAEQLAGTVSQGATAAANQARELLEGLRLDRPDQDFAETIREICRRWTQAGSIPVRARIADVEPSVEIRYELTRILQEALNNIARHAGAQQVDLAITRTRNGLGFRLRDDGFGFTVPEDLGALRTGGHYGVVGMAERARSVNGTLRLISAPGRGTTLEVLVPTAVSVPGLLPVTGTSR